MFALLLPIERESIEMGIDDLMDVMAVHPETGDLILFPTREEAVDFREEYMISSQIIELFIV